MSPKIPKAKAFTLVEIVITICIIGILAVGIVSLSGDKELTKMYRAESCINEIDGKIKVFMNAALTSKKLTISENNTYIGVFPDYYIIEFAKNSNKIIFKYEGAESGTGIYQEIPLSGFCKDKIALMMTGSFPFTTVKMNKGFQQITHSELKTFSLLP
ncbi:MAG: prepilin-type N-terminal cleavage/methylation domain-containing protein [Candidatus Peribacteria bacterium]|jgi:prepilin-type N-terminal cleavage/methylation domain-containing protein|nr:prepilin-type N-terminal cleavage/methylation domain-containing protein [Candidatus Peribacteria bacterium]